MQREEAESIIDPYIDQMQEWLFESWKWLQQRLDADAELRKTCDFSIQAAMVYNQFVERMQQGFVDDPDVKIDRHGRMVTFLFSGVLRLRFKKLDGKLRSGNVQTNRQRTLYWQLLLPGMDNKLTDVTFGYVTDRVCSVIKGVYITCPIGWRKNKWFIPIVDPNDGQMSIFDQPTQPMTPAAAIEPVRADLPKYASKIKPPKTQGDA